MQTQKSPASGGSRILTGQETGCMEVYRNDAETTTVKPPTTGWFWQDNSLVDDKLRIIGPVGYAVYGVLVRHANNRRVAEIYVARIASLIGMGHKTVRRALKRLSVAGLIRIERRLAKHGTNAKNRYHLLPVAPPLGLDTRDHTPGHRCPPIQDYSWTDDDVHKPFSRGNGRPR